MSDFEADLTALVAANFGASEEVKKRMHAVEARYYEHDEHRTVASNEDEILDEIGY